MDPNNKAGAFDEVYIDLEDLQQDMVSLNSKEQSTDRKVELLSAIVSKQHGLISNLKDNVVELTRKSLVNELVILNLPESPPNANDLPSAIKDTIIRLGFTEQIDVELVYRRGPPPYRPKRYTPPGYREAPQA